jgi:hypothetical protein
MSGLGPGGHPAGRLLTTSEVHIPVLTTTIYTLMNYSTSHNQQLERLYGIGVTKGFCMPCIARTEVDTYARKKKL